MSYKYSDFRKMTDEEFEKAYDKVAEHTVSALNTMSHEAQRRESEKGYKRLLNVLELQKKENNKSNKTIKTWTIAIGIMTAVMLAATIINVIVAVYG